ncbi:hypothetical protein FACS1894152_4410 [Bacilli bacterium]|nr:hypothetical protein FACS1894152_4410 [Bacilli bacterium]
MSEVKIANKYGEFVNYTGEVDENGQPKGDGFGEFKYKKDKDENGKDKPGQNVVYIGQMKDGRPFGRGMVIWEDGSRVMGEFYGGRTPKDPYVRLEKQKLKQPRANDYGQFVNYAGEVDEKGQAKGKGFGEFKYKNGDVYIGEMENGRPVGIGLVTWVEDGRSRTGEFNGRRIPAKEYYVSAPKPQLTVATPAPAKPVPVPVPVPTPTSTTDEIKKVQEEAKQAEEKAKKIAEEASKNNKKPTLEGGKPRVGFVGVWEEPGKYADESKTFKGKWEEGGIFEGTIDDSDDDNSVLYVGRFKNGKLHGFGTEVHEGLHTGGMKYEGYWKDGKLEGKGVITSVYEWNSNYRYEGDFVNGEKEGKGVETDSHGNVYDGEWKNGKKEGKGILRYSNGDVDIGEWKDSELHKGSKIYIGKDGKVHKQKMYKGNPAADPELMDGIKTLEQAIEQEKKIYGIGQQSQQQKTPVLTILKPSSLSQTQTPVTPAETDEIKKVQEEAKQAEEKAKQIAEQAVQNKNEPVIEGGKPRAGFVGVWEGSDEYGYKYDRKTFEGRWNDDGTFDGIVSCRAGHIDKQIYAGQFNKNGRLDGHGTWTHRLHTGVDFYKYEGDFVNGKKEGKGVGTDEDGNVYEGEWKNDEVDGKGIKYAKDGNVYIGEWKHDTGIHEKDKLCKGSRLFLGEDGKVYKQKIYNDNPAEDLELMDGIKTLKQAIEQEKKIWGIGQQSQTVPSTPFPTPTVSPKSTPPEGVTNGEGVKRGSSGRYAPLNSPYKDEIAFVGNFKDKKLVDGKTFVAHGGKVYEETYAKGETKGEFNSIEDAVGKGKLREVPGVKTLDEAIDKCKKEREQQQPVKKMLGLFAGTTQTKVIGSEELSNPNANVPDITTTQQHKNAGNGVWEK